MSDDPFVVGFLLFPTLLDLIGPYQVFSQVPGFEVHLIAKTAAPVADNNGVCLTPTATLTPRRGSICFVCRVVPARPMA